MKAPQGDIVIAVAGKAIDELAPEVEAPHLGHVDLGGIAGIGVAW